jgi:predicted ester cyclase
MDRREIEALVGRWAAAAVGEGQVDVFDEILSEDVRDLSGYAETRGRESFKARARALRQTLSDVRLTVDDLVVDGDAIAWRWTLTGMAKTRVTLSGANFQKIAGGRVVEHWTLADLARLKG